MNNGGDGGWVWKTEGDCTGAATLWLWKRPLLLLPQSPEARGQIRAHHQGGEGKEREKRETFFLLPSSTTVDDLLSLHWFLCAWLAWIMEAPTTMVVGGGEIMPPIQQKTSIFAPSAIPTPRPCMPSAHRRQDLRAETFLIWHWRDQIFQRSFFKSGQRIPKKAWF